MYRYILNRLAVLMLILFGLSFMTFSLTYQLPSDPVEQLIDSMGGPHDEQVIANLKEKYGLDRPFIVQYKDWLLGAVHGDFSDSVKYNQPVSEIMARKLPNTIKLACTSFGLMLVCALPLGVLSAVYHNRPADYIIRMLSFIGVSLPSFWIGLLLIYYLAVRWHLLPVSGSESWKNMVMPAVTLAVNMTALYIRRIRAVMLEQMNQEYIVGALSRGVGKFKIIFRHVLPNSLLSIVTMLGMSFGYLLGGTMIVESIFGWNGIGKAAVDAIANRDYNLIQGYVMWMGIIFVVVNLIVDISYRSLDPRIRKGEIKC